MLFCNFHTLKVREIRRAVLLNRAADDVDSDTEWENPEDGSQATGTVGTPRPGIGDIKCPGY